MLEIAINNTLPNQKFSFKTQSKTLVVELRTTSDNITLMSVSYNGNPIVQSVKVAPNCLIMCYDHLQQNYGDFMFSTENDEYPYSLTEKGKKAWNEIKW